MQRNVMDLSVDETLVILQFLDMVTQNNLKLTSKSCTLYDALWFEKYKIQAKKLSHSAPTTKNFYYSYIKLLQQAYATEQQRIQEKLLATKLLHSSYTYLGRESLLSRHLPTDSKRKVKATFVGAPGIGKNTLIFKIANDKYIPSLGWMPYVVNCLGTQNYSRRQVFEEFRDKDENIIQLWNTPGQSDYYRLRPLSYNETNVCFDVSNSATIDPVIDTFINEVLEKGPPVPVLLCGLKSELRYKVSNSSTPIPEGVGELLAKHSKCLGYFDVSSNTSAGCADLMTGIMKASLITLENIKKEKKCCTM